MAEVGWSDEALTQLDLIRAYLEQFDPPAARRLAARLIEAALSLQDFPERGRPARDGRRALVGVRPYIIFYAVDGDTVRVTSIRHAAQIFERDVPDQ